MARLTPETARLILAAIRAGSYPASAAASAGVRRLELRAWLQRGRAEKGGRYRRFWLEVDKAEAQARARAEIEARDTDVKFWLRHGPAKEAWVAAGKGGKKKDRQPSAADFFRLVGNAVEVLAPFPEARQAVANAIPARGSG